jgi:glyceraldehyde 3-phosphate dehydrogenase
MTRVAINGLGRIGRATLKLVLAHEGLELVAVNDLASAQELAYLLRYDSVYGRSARQVSTLGNRLVVDGQEIAVLNQREPARLPWAEMGVDLVFECTGNFTKAEDLRQHLEAGARRVILSAPSKSAEVLTVVPGVNHAGEEQVFSCASCTTNCVAPVMEVLARRIGVAKALMTTVHAYTSSQAIVDRQAGKPERGRAAAINLVPTSTGAAQAALRVLPDLAGRFDGLAIRAPVPAGSLVDLTLVTARPTSVEEVNSIFREEAINPAYTEVLAVTEEPVVSSDVVRDPHAAVVDLRHTRVVDGDLVKVLAWYDNEWGYAAQMVREAARLNVA